MAGINLTKVKARLNNVKKNLYYEKKTTLKLYKLNTLLHEFKSNWYMETRPTSNIATGEEYFLLYITDVDKKIVMEDIIILSTIAAINDTRYQVTQFFRPRGLTKQWELRLKSLDKVDTE